MNLAELSTQPAGTSADIQVQVTQLLNSGTNTYGPWCKVKIEDASGTQDIMCTGALQVNQVYTLAMKWKNDPKYGMQLSGKITNGQLDPSPSPAQTLADTNQYKAAPPVNVAPAPEQPTRPVQQPAQQAPAQQPQFQIDNVGKGIIAQCAAKIVKDLIAGGTLQSSTNPGNTVQDNIQEWAGYIKNVAGKL